MAAQPQTESTETPNAIHKNASSSIAEQPPVEQTQKEEKSTQDSDKTPIEGKPDVENAEAITKDISKKLGPESAGKEISIFGVAEIVLPAMIASLGPKLSSECLILAGQIKFNLVKFNEAEIYFDQAIKEHKNSVSYEALAMAAEVKYHLKKWAEAEQLYESASKLQKFLTGEGDFPLKNLAQMAEIKYRLNEWKAADKLYDEVVNDYRRAYRKKSKDSPSAKELIDILLKAAYVKTCLENYSGAIDHFDYIANLVKKGRL